MGILGMVNPTLIENPHDYTATQTPCYWMYDHPPTQGINRSLDPSTTYGNMVGNLEG